MKTDKYNSYRHFYLYAKGHYVRQDLFTDMKILMSERCGIEVEHVRMSDVISCLSQEVLDTYLRHRHNDQLLSNILARIRPVDFFGYSEKIPSDMTMRDFMDDRIINALLHEMMFMEVADIEGDLGEPDPKILSIIKHVR